MKRYNIVQKGNLLEVPWIEQESPTGEWVKYEPWMDEAEKQYKHELTIDDLPKPKMPISEPGGYIVKGPTICIKCKHHTKAHQGMKDRYGIFHTDDVCYITIKKLDFVKGIKQQKDIVVACDRKNHGNCPDYEPKDQVKDPKDQVKDPTTCDICGNELILTCPECKKAFIPGITTKPDPDYN